MLTKNEIKSVWKSVGWNNEEQYHQYLCSNKNVLYKNLNEFLDPDKISPKLFWEATDEHFGTDTVCNVVQFAKKSSLSIKECNKENHLIPQHLGMLGFVDLAIHNIMRSQEVVSIGEIGCGYGSFYENYVSKRDDIALYKGFDVVKRFDQAHLIEGKDGNFTNKQVKELKHTINLFYSCNVFQHLTPKKIKKYLKQMYQILPFTGRCVLAYVKRPPSGVSYYYGQRVEIMHLDEFYKACTDVGFKIELKTEQSHNRNTFDSVVVFLSKYDWD